MDVVVKRIKIVAKVIINIQKSKKYKKNIDKFAYF